MDTDHRSLFVTRKVFMRRLATRLLASAVAMSALHALSAGTEGGGPALSVFHPAGHASDATSREPERVAAIDAVPIRSEPATRALSNASSERTDRLHRRGFASSRASSRPDRSASRTDDVVVEGVIPFHHCLPDCDSRDPLLVSNRVAAAGPYPDEARSEPWDATPMLLADNGKAARSNDASDGLVRSTYREVRSLVQAGGRSIGAGLQAVNAW